MDLEWHKGKDCRYKPGTVCQEGYCSDCIIKKEHDNLENREQKPVEPWGKLYPRNFRECPVCRCPAVFSEKCEAEEFTPEEIKKRAPYLQAIKHEYNHGLYHYVVITIMDTCVNCGVMYTLARDKKKIPLSALSLGKNLHFGAK